MYELKVTYTGEANVIISGNEIDGLCEISSGGKSGFIFEKNTVSGTCTIEALGTGEFVFSDSLSKKLSENYLEKLGVYQKIRVEQEEEGNKRNIEVSFLIHSILPFFNLNEKKITIVGIMMLK